MTLAHTSFREIAAECDVRVAIHSYYVARLSTILGKHHDMKNWDLFRDLAALQKQAEDTVNREQVHADYARDAINN